MTHTSIPITNLFKRDTYKSGIKITLLVVGLLWIPMLQKAQTSDPESYNLPEDCNNFVRIEGSSNVNQFVFSQQIPDHLKADQAYRGGSRLLTIEIPAHNFKASNPLMYNDFLKLIQAESYPVISIRIYYNPNELQAQKTRQVFSRIEVNLAGQQNSYTIPGTLVVCKNQSLKVQGSVRLSLLDFKLEPPAKFFGMVKVNQEVFVNFGLTLDNLLLTKNEQH